MTYKELYDWIGSLPETTQLLPASVYDDEGVVRFITGTVDNHAGWCPILEISA